MKDKDNSYATALKGYLSSIRSEYERSSYHVGDWVLENDVPHRWTEDDYNREQMSNISKMPLTPDILHLNGWLYDEEAEEWSKDGVPFCIMIDTGFDYDGLDAAFKKFTIRPRNRDIYLFVLTYVDILQTLLRLSNIESQANEFLIASKHSIKQ